MAGDHPDANSFFRALSSPAGNDEQNRKLFSPHIMRAEVDSDNSRHSISNSIAKRNRSHQLINELDELCNRVAQSRRKTGDQQ